VILLGIDLGERRIGFAVSDEEERLAVPSGFAKAHGREEALAAILKKAEAERAALLVVGYPLNMNGRPSQKSREAEDFRDRLAAAGLDVVLWDERLTTAEAARLLKEAGLNRRRRRPLIDAHAAQCLLGSFLEARRRIN
jgi:putative Holliday junction resolvase